MKKNKNYLIKEIDDLKNENKLLNQKIIDLSKINKNFNEIITPLVIIDSIIITKKEDFDLINLGFLQI